MPVEIEIYSDVICPWCYLGRHRLQRALELLGPEERPRVIWRAFELNPGMPPAGISRREYRTAKFGSWEHSQALDARVARLGGGEGVPFAFERMERTPNTLAAHRLIRLAHLEGGEAVQDALVEALFRAYFVEGQDVGDPPMLLQLAAASGMDAGRVAGYLSGDEGLAEVRREEEAARRLGIDSVPTFVLNGGRLLAGAQPPGVLAAAIREAALSTE